jgi:hypothetical protein
VYYPTIIKINSSGTLQWQYVKGVEVWSSGDPTYIERDSSDNIYFLSPQRNPTGPTEYLNIMKINSSGTKLWERNLQTTTGGGDTKLPAPGPLAVDSSGNVYINVFGFNSGTFTIVKYNTSGILQWQQTRAVASNNVCMVCDSSGNLYVAFVNTYILYIMKLTSAGAITWQRQITGTSTSVVWGMYGNSSSKVDKYDNLYLNVGAPNNITMRIPSSGAFTGTYVLNSISYTIAASSLSFTSGTVVDSAGAVGLSAASNTYTTVTGTAPTTRNPTTTSSVALL